MSTPTNNVFYFLKNDSHIVNIKVICHFTLLTAVRFQNILFVMTFDGCCCCVFALCSFDGLVSIRRFLGSSVGWVSVRHMSVCMPWTSTQITGCSGCFDVIPHSKLQGASISSEEADSGRVSPVLTDPVIVSPRPRHHNRRSESQAVQRPFSFV